MSAWVVRVCEEPPEPHWMLLGLARRVLEEEVEDRPLPYLWAELQLDSLVAPTQMLQLRRQWTKGLHPTTV